MLKRRKGEKSAVATLVVVFTLIVVVVAVAVAPFNEGPSAVALALIAEAFKTAAGARVGS